MPCAISHARCTALCHVNPLVLPEGGPRAIKARADAAGGRLPPPPPLSLSCAGGGGGCLPGIPASQHKQRRSSWLRNLFRPSRWPRPGRALPDERERRLFGPQTPGLRAFTGAGRRAPVRVRHPSPSSESAIRFRHPSPSSEPAIRVRHPSPPSESVIRVHHPSPPSESVIRFRHPSPSGA